MKKTVDYNTADEYDWTLFTEEDKKEYKQILLSIAYDPDLARFFHEQKQLRTREGNWRKRYCNESVTAALNEGAFAAEAIDDREEEEQKRKEEEILRSEIEKLEPVPRRRLRAHFFQQMTYVAIAEKEGVSAVAVCLCVNRAIEKMREGFRKNQ